MELFSNKFSKEVIKILYKEFKVFKVRTKFDDQKSVIECITEMDILEAYIFRTQRFTLASASCSYIGKIYVNNRKLIFQYMSAFLI